MARRARPEEHVNHERWLVSYADMVTLLFALFVVLYAMGVTDLEKLKKLKQSIQFAFHIAGEGKTKDDGLYEKQRGGGDTVMPVPLVTAQSGAMKEFVHELLPQLEEVAGKSLEIVQRDDTISASWPLSAFFDAGRPQPVRRDVFNVLVKVVQGSITFTSDIRVIVEAPDVILGEHDGRPVTSLELCNLRLWTLRKALIAIPGLRPEMVRIELAQQKELPAAPGGSAPRAGDWEDRARVTIAFSNMRTDGR